MTMPQLKAINELVLRSHEIFILAGGFEERVFNFPKMICPHGGTQNDALILEYLPNNSKNRPTDLLSILAEKELSVSSTTYDRYAPESFATHLIGLLNNLKTTSVCLDISGMSRFAIMIIMDIVRELRLPLRIVYAEALQYAPTRDEFEKAKTECSQHLPTSFIHTGIYDVLHVARLSSIRMQNHATLLIAFDSFNEALCQALVNSINPSNLILINGRPPREELEWREEAMEYVHHCLRKEWSVGDDNKPTETTSTLYYNETYELLVRLYWEFSSSHRIILAPTGSKMQAIGCYLLRAVHNDVHIEYPVVQGFFADKYSTGVRECWELDLGDLHVLVEQLRKDELAENLGLPPEPVDAEIK
jgi:hypothetical protein